MKITKLILCVAVAIQLLSTGCKKSIDSRPNTIPTISYQIKTENVSATLNQRVAANFKWTSGYASSTLIKFEAKKGVEEIEFKMAKVQKIDLLSLASTSLGNITLVPATYNEVEFKIELNKNGNDAALELAGVFTGNNTTIPVLFTTKEQLEIKVERNNVEITNGSVYSFLAIIDLSDAAADVTQTALLNAQKSNGAVVISSSMNVNLYNKILSNLKRHHLGDFRHN